MSVLSLRTGRANLNDLSDHRKSRCAERRFKFRGVWEMGRGGVHCDSQLISERSLRLARPVQESL